jgi:hypothetical protein
LTKQRGQQNKGQQNKGQQNKGQQNKGQQNKGVRLVFDWKTQNLDVDLTFHYT